ncbi:MAG: Eco57I restriction-modification methylase domain-containing protein [Candidatus Heimdallarchaeota archaeon]|nr:Eco57I restriction-modification methylase domain-containing protein [Candidatus Heimdallarchaeota archaeon]
MSPNQNQRKKTGEFYTPSIVVDFMIERVFDRLNSQGRIISNSYEEFSNSLSKISFCDPSVGTGNFILGLLNWIWNKLKSYSQTDGKLKIEFFFQFVTCNIFGVDLNYKSIVICKERIKQAYSFFKNQTFDNLKCGNSIVDIDANEMFSPADIKLLNPFSWENSFQEQIAFDVIIGNPPYFNLKKNETRNEETQPLFHYLKTSKLWSNLFRASSDIYYFFIIKSLSLLKKQGIVSLITPNYWLENQYADLLRKRIIDYQPLEIIDLEGIRVFKDEGRWLSVSTCIFTAMNSPPEQELTVFQNLPKNFFELRHKNKNILKPFSVSFSDLDSKKWILSPYLSTIKKINNNKKMDRLGAIAKVAQGLSPGVKELFVMKNEKVKLLSIEKEILVPFVTNKNVQRWKTSQNNELFAILPSRIKNLSEFPNVHKYFMKHKQRLTAGPDRKKLLEKKKIRWFDYSVYRNLSDFNNSKEKILCPYRSLIPRFSLDLEQHFGATDIYAIIPKDEDDILCLLGILNSNFIDFWFREAGKKKGKMLEFFSFPLKNIPIPPKQERSNITPYVKQILSELNQNGKESGERIAELENILNGEICQMYGLNEKFLENYVKGRKHI